MVNLSRLTSMVASSEIAVFQSEAVEKLSVRRTLPTPGFCSGVGALVGKIWGDGVAEGGNQTMVAVGGGVSVAGSGTSGIWAPARLVQAVSAAVIKPEMKMWRRRF